MAQTRSAGWFGNCLLSGLDRKWLARGENDAIDPNVWSGRALQEVFVDLVVSGLASMYPVSSWSCFAPDHHGYQRACVLIMRQASTGPCGSPVFACAGKTDPDRHKRLSGARVQDPFFNWDLHTPRLPLLTQRRHGHAPLAFAICALCGLGVP
jgi:hypothetical protein